MAESNPQTQSTIIVGISGPSSSGKTTLARLLQQIFFGTTLTEPEEQSQSSKLNTFIIHEDDFYYPDDQIPYTMTKSGKIQDWDTIDAINTSFLSQALSYVHENGHLPPRLRSKEDQNESTDSGVDEDTISQMRKYVQETLSASATNANPKSKPRPKTIAFMEGFLLYTGKECHTSPLKPVQDAIHLPLFLPASYTNVKSRREARSGYVTIGPQPTEEEAKAKAKGQTQEKAQGAEGEEVDLEKEDESAPQHFWVDPPGYVDDIVWPRYVEDHAWLLVADESEDGEEGDLIRRVGEGTEVREDAGVRVAPGKGAAGMDVILGWAVKEIVNFYVAFE